MSGSSDTEGDDERWERQRSWKNNQSEFYEDDYALGKEESEEFFVSVKAEEDQDWFVEIKKFERLDNIPDVHAKGGKFCAPECCQIVQRTTLEEAEAFFKNDGPPDLAQEMADMQRASEVGQQAVQACEVNVPPEFSNLLDSDNDQRCRYKLAATKMIAAPRKGIHRQEGKQPIEAAFPQQSGFVGSTSSSRTKMNKKSM